MSKGLDFSPGEMKRLIRKIGKPLFEGEKDPSRIGRAARLLDLSQRTGKAYWYGEWNPKPEHVIAAKRMCGEPVGEVPRDEIAEMRASISQLQADLLETRARLDRVEGGRPGEVSGLGRSGRKRDGRQAHILGSPA